jgi:hypothetical protein
MPNSKLLTCIIDFSSGEWLPIVLTSYRTFFPDSPALLIDNNPMPNGELLTIAQRFGCALLRSEGAQDDGHLYVDGAFGHGVGMDLALEYARQRGFEYLLHLEPDCLILGESWWTKFEEALLHGASMVGSHRKAYGPIHPTPSVWRVNDVTTSFRAGAREDDILHPRFAELFDLPGLRRRTAQLYTPDIREWFEKNWDTAQRAWFLLAVENKTALVNQSDVIHYWAGSRRGPREVGDDRLLSYL